MKTGLMKTGHMSMDEGAGVACSEQEIVEGVASLAGRCTVQERKCHDFKAIQIPFEFLLRREVKNHI